MTRYKILLVNMVEHFVVPCGKGDTGFTDYDGFQYIRCSVTTPGQPRKGMYKILKTQESTCGGFR